MLLSDAIRAGCEVTDPGRTGERRTILATQKACALGAALLTTRWTTYGALAHEWPCLNQSLPPDVVPAAWRRGLKPVPRPLSSFIIYANDVIGASREAIAEWVDYLHDEGAIDARHRGESEALAYIDAGLAALAPQLPDPHRPTRLLPSRRA